MTYYKPFQPMGNTFWVQANATASTLKEFNTTIGAPQVRVFNEGPAVAFLQLSNSNANASVANATVQGRALPISVGNPEIFTIKSSYVSVITLSGTANVYLTPGAGF